MPEGKRAPAGLKKDSYQRADIIRSTTQTRPLSPRPTGALQALPALVAELSAMVAKAPKAFAHLEPRIEILMRACAASNLPVPGVTLGQYVHALTPKTEQLIGYLQDVLMVKRELLRDVQVAIFRFFDAKAAVARAESALAAHVPTVQLLEELRQKFFYLGRLHLAFQGDAVLAQLFSPPKTVGAPAPAPAMPQSLSPVDQLRERAQRDAALLKAETLAHCLKPKLAPLKIALEPLSGKGLGMGGLFTPEGRLGRMLAMRISTQPALCEQLRRALQLYDQLLEGLAAAKTGGDLSVLDEASLPLLDLMVGFQRTPLLKELFPGEEGGPARSPT